MYDLNSFARGSPTWQKKSHPRHSLPSDAERSLPDEHWPPPEEAERERKRLDALRPWHRIAWVLVGVLVVVGLYLKAKELGGW